MSKQKFSVAVEKIDAKFAAAALERNYHKQRPLSEDRIKQLVAAIKAGTFNAYHPSIAFNDNGELIDGQHRLEAIRRADIPQLMPVSHGVPEDKFAYIDIGRLRSMADRTGIPKKSAEVLTTLFRLALGDNHPKPRDIELIYAHLEQVLTKLNSHKSCVGGTAAVRAALVALAQAYPANVENINAQYKAFVNDDYGVMNKSVLAFYKRVKTKGNKKNKVSTTDRETMFSLALAAFNPIDTDKKSVRGDETEKARMTTRFKKMLTSLRTQANGI